MSTLPARRAPLTGGLVLLSLTAALATALLVTAPAHALRTPAGAGPRQVTVYTFWNAEYLCLAARVHDSALTGSSIAPMTAAEQDDAIEFDLEVPTVQGVVAHRLVISAAGGMNMLTRDPAGNWRSDNAWVRGPRTIKYAVAVKGTLNNPRDTDTEFTVECAIPWEFLGGVPREERALPFNVICHMQGENEGIVSWSPGVTSEAEVADSTRWGRLLLTRSIPPVAAQEVATTAPVSSVVPFVDGALGAEEWMAAGILTFAKPEPVFQPKPAAAPAVARRAAFASILAIYRYDWEPSKFWRANGLPATVDQPKEAPGPWYDFRRADWHQAQLQEVKRSGVDTLLVHYRGDPESRRVWARTGLDRLTQALKELRGEGRSYPLLGLYLDTEPLQGVDLKSEEGKRLCYGMIRDFFRHVPADFRAQLGSDPERAVPGGVPILLGEPQGLADWDGTFQEFVAERLARDFHARVRWLGSTAWAERGAQDFYADVRLSTGAPVQSTRGDVVAFTVSPGYCPPPGTPGDVRPRREGRAYRGDWQRILTTGADLVVINSWNDFSNSTEIAPSRQHGFVYGDATRFFKALLASQQPRALRFAYAAVPEVLQPGRQYVVEFVVENAGTEDVSSSNPTVTADQRIVRRSDGKEVFYRIGAQEVTLLAGQTRRFAAVIPTKGSDGKPLPPGEYLYSLLLTRSRVPLLRSKFLSHTEAELTVPITVGQPPARHATLISTSLPSSMESGSTDRVAVQVRNDGAETWKRGDVFLSYRWMRCAEDLGGAEAPQVIGEGLRVPLPKQIAPGEVALVEVGVTAAGADGAALPPSDPDGAWGYRIQWDLVQRDGGWFSQGDRPAGEEAIEVVSRERTAVFASAKVPQTVQAGERFTADVVVGNAGLRPWPASVTGVACTWVSWDGHTTVMGADSDRFSTDVAPGEKRTRQVSLRAPEAAGPYWLVWSITGEADAVAGRRQDMLVTPITVTTAKLRAVDLSSLANVIAVTSDSYRTRGTFDNASRSFPDECLPPDESGVTTGLYPSGCYASSRDSGNPGPVVFAFPETSSGMGGAVACDGQTIELGERGVRRIHLLVTSTEGIQQAAFALHLVGGGTEQMTLRVPSWIERDESTPLAGYTPYLRGLNGDDAQQAYLYHLEIAPTSGLATSLELPGSMAVKILAITVEEEPQPQPAGGGS